MPVWPPQGRASFAYKTPCCECPVLCSFVIPRDITLGGTTEYDDATIAQDAINDQVSSCLVYSEIQPVMYDLFFVEAGTSVLDLEYVYGVSCPPPPPPFPPPPPVICGADLIQWFGIAAKTGMISIPYSVVTTAVSSAVDDIVEITIYDQSYSVVATATDSTQGDTSGTFNITLPNGNYIVKVQVVRHVDPSSSPFTITSDFRFEFVPDTEVCLVTADYNDGEGGTGTLECGTCVVADCLSKEIIDTDVQLTVAASLVGGPGGDLTVDVALAFTNNTVIGTIDYDIPSDGNDYSIVIRIILPDTGDTCDIYFLTPSDLGPGPHHIDVNEAFGWPILSLRQNLTALLFGDTVNAKTTIDAAITSGPDFPAAYSSETLSPLGFTGSATDGIDCQGYMISSETPAGGACELSPLGTISAKVVRARVTVTKLVIGFTYQAIINIGERPYGTMDPFEVVAIAIIEFVATDETETTPYADIIPEFWNDDFIAESCYVRIL